MLLRRTGPTTALTALVVAGLLSGCGAGPGSAAAADISAAFHHALGEGDGEGACALLSPAAVEEVEAAAGADCAEAVLAEDIPVAGDVIDASAYGVGAQVRLDGDVVFLGRFDGAWRVIAAGCTPRPDQPYDCVLQGG